MPIYDNNGTTSYKIGKIYDNNGTTNTQIKRVYDNDGTTSSVVYRSDEFLFPGTDTYSGGWGVSTPAGDNGTSVSDVVLSARSATNNTYGRIYSYQKIDLTSISSLVFTVTNYSKTGNATLALGINATWNNVVTPGNFNRCVEPSGNGNITLNVSDKTGLWYVILAAWGSTGGSRMDITQIAII